MAAVVSTLCLPRISKKIPLSVTAKSTGSAHVASLFAEREALGLPTIYPDASVHRDIEEVLLKNLCAVGYQPNAYSERYIKISVCAINGDIDFDDGSELLNNYVVAPEAIQINLQEPITKLEGVCAGLGETVMYWIKTAMDKQCIPGFKMADTLYELFATYRLEDAETDAEAFDLLVGMGYHEDEAKTYLPSVIKNSLGGDIFIAPKQKVKAGELLKQLKQAEFKNAARLVQLLKKELPSKFGQARDALLKGPTYYWQSYSFDVLITGGSRNHNDQNAIREFIDQMDNDRANNGESDDELFVQRVDVKLNSDGSFAHSYKDGLQVLAKLFNAWTCLEEVISLLDEHMVTNKISKEFQ